VLAPLLVSAAEKFGFDYALKSADRSFLECEIFDSLLARQGCRRILFAGVEIYTCHYGRFFPGRTFHTIDWDADKAHYGNKRFHRTGSVCDLDKLYPAAAFDAVLFNGLVGYGLDLPTDVDLAIAKAYCVLSEGGILIVGWNNTAKHLSFTLDELPSYRLFQPFTPAIAGVSGNRITIRSDNNHTFDFLIKQPEVR